MYVLAALAFAGGLLGHANPLVHEPLAVLAFPLGISLLALFADSPKQAALWALATAGITYTCNLYWVAVPVHDYGYLPWILAAPCPMLLGTYLAAYMALYALLLHLARDRFTGLSLGVVAGLLWAGLELLVEYAFTGFPWLTLASGLVARPWAIQGTALFGSAGLAFVVVTALVSMLAPNAGGWRPRVLGLVLLGILAGYGLSRMEAPLPETATARVAMAQGNIDQGQKWSVIYQQTTVSRYTSLSEGAATQGMPDLVIWPETAMPFYLQDPIALSRTVRDYVRASGTYLLTGAPAYTRLEGGDIRLFNRAFLLGPAGQTTDTYDKAHLVPYGEYVPFGLPLDKLVAMVGDFLPGEDPSPLMAGDLALGMLICYEAIFPDLAQERTVAGANLLVNISNDAWFGRTAAPYQHLHQAALRAVEQGRWVARATNTGVTAFIDPKGRIIQPTDIYVPAAINSEVGLITAPTVYHRIYGPLRVGLGALAVLAALWLVLAGPPRTAN